MRLSPRVWKPGDTAYLECFTYEFRDPSANTLNITRTWQPVKIMTVHEHVVTIRYGNGTLEAVPPDGLRESAAAALEEE